MIRFRRRGMALLGTAVLTAATVGVVPAATATAQPRTLAAQGTPFGQAGFAAYGTGSELALSALRTGTTTLAKVDQAFSGVTAAGGNLSGAVVSPITGSLVQPALVGANASARGSGLEVGLGLTTAQANQIQLGIAQSQAAPPNQVGTIAGPAVSAVPLQINGLIQTGALHGFAATNYVSTFCPVGQPIAFGLGGAAAPTTVLSTVVASPGAATSSTATSLVANSDGTFGLATQVGETIAPLLVTLVPGALPTTLEVDVQGTSVNNPVSLTAATDGEGHSAMVLGNADPSVTVKLTLAGVVIPPITASLATLAPLLNNLVGPTSALHALLAGLGLNLSISLGDGHTVTSPLPTFANATNAISGSYDLLALHLGLGTTTVADLRLGHMEAYAALPSGSISCTVPVAKTANPAVVTAGNTFTWTISVPSSATILGDSFCDLTNIMATDKISIQTGSPTFTIGSISDNGVYNASTQTITWPNLGNYHPGAPPKLLTIQVSVPSGSTAGVLKDTANVTAGLGNCNGGATGTVSASGNVSNVVVTGTITLLAPQITANGAGGLATTGTGPMLPWIAAGLLLLAEATRRVLRRAHSRP